MKTIKDFCGNFKILGLAMAGLAVMLTGCETTSDGGKADKAEVGSLSGGVYRGLSFTMRIPPEMKTNLKKTDQELVHYFFTQEMAQRKVGMGIYEGRNAVSFERFRKDLMMEENEPAQLDKFVGSVSGGATIHGKRWRQFFVFPPNSNMTLQIFWFDVDQRDEETFLAMTQTIRAVVP